jgi:ATPase subunit of ABC transporter with duplicated ATPase domains
VSATLLAKGLRRVHGSTVVLDGIDLTVSPGSRIGVVGPNGVGKSTLLRLLAGAETADAGTVVRMPPNATVGWVPQEVERRAGETVLACLARRTGVTGAEAAMTAAAVALGEGGDETTYSDALERWLALGGADLDRRAEAVSTDVGLDGVLHQEMATLSGGQAARVSLAVILLARFDVFLLDEPTNDLDFAGLARLERFLDELAGGVVVVSHDRAFLDRTITSVLELDEHARTGALFAGGWSAFLELRATARRHAEEEYAEYSTEKQRLGARTQMQREWAVQGVRDAKKKATDNDKNVRHFRSQSSEHVAAKAKQTQRASERLVAVEKPWEGWALQYEIAVAERAGDVVARLDKAVVTRGTFSLGPIDLELAWGERVLLAGPNGSGKTTLLSAILGRVPLSSGQRWLGPGVVVGELEQARDRFAGSGSLLDAFVEASGVLPREARSLLAKFGLTAGHVGRPAGSLSPGERTRAGLALLQARGVNVLILDEPTNHLDLPAIEQLEAALDRFPGTVVLVSHDRQLRDAVRVDRSIELA